MKPNLPARSVGATESCLAKPKSELPGFFERTVLGFGSESPLVFDLLKGDYNEQTV